MRVKGSEIASTSAFSAFNRFCVPAFLPPIFLFCSLVLGSEKDSQVLEIPLRSFNGVPLLIEASQHNGDVAIQLLNGVGDVISSSDIPSRHWLNEFLLLEESSCAGCTLQLIKISPNAVLNSKLVKQLSLRDASAASLKLLNKLNLIAKNYKHHLLGDIEKQGAKTLMHELRAAIDLSDAVSEKGWRYHLLFLYGEALHSLENYEAQNETLKYLVEETQDRSPKYHTLALMELGATNENSQEGIAQLDRSISIAKQNSLSRIESKGLNYKGVAQVREGKISLGISNFNKALKIFRALGLDYAALSPLHNLSWAHLEAGELPQALSYMMQLKFLADASGYLEYQLWALYDMAKVYREEGQVHSAETLLDEAISIIDSRSDDALMHSVGELPGYVLQEKAQLLYEYGDYERSYDYAKQAEKFYEAGSYKRDQTNAIYHQSKALAAQRKFDEAISTYKQVLVEDEKNNRRKDAALTHYELARIHEVNGDTVEAANYIVLSLNGLHGTDHTASLAKSLSLSGRILNSLGEPQKALSVLSETIPLARKSNNQHVLADALYRKATILYDKEAFKEAAESLETARKIVERLLGGVSRRDLQRSYLALQRELFAAQIRLAIAQEDSSEQAALAIAESFRARTLKETLKRDRKNFNESIVVQNERRTLYKTLRKYALEVHGSSHTETVLTRSREILEQLEKLESKSAVETPYASPQKQPKQNATGGFESLSTDILGLYFFISEDRSWLWAIRGDTVSLHELPGKNELAAAVSRVVNMIGTHPANRGFGMGAYEQNKAINEISDMLLRPVLHTTGLQGTSSLVIYADGILNQLPFSVLRNPQTGRPLVENSAIRYLPSLSAVDANTFRSKGTTENRIKKTLIVADPVVETLVPTVLGRSTRPLPYSLTEANAIASLREHNAKILAGANANKSKLMAELQQPLDILHVATHAFVHPTEPSLSGLLFSATEAEESLWLIPEIAHQRIDAKLVVLSACEGAKGRLVSGEGPMSLSRAFFDAGVSEVVGSLWKVQDDATAILMKTFYKHHLTGKLRVNEALRRAQLSVFKDKNNNWRDPYFWAGFATFGSGKAIVVSEQEPPRNSI